MWLGALGLSVRKPQTPRPPRPDPDPTQQRGCMGLSQGCYRTLKHLRPTTPSCPSSSFLLHSVGIDGQHQHIDSFTFCLIPFSYRFATRQRVSTSASVLATWDTPVTHAALRQALVPLKYPPPLSLKRLRTHLRPWPPWTLRVCATRPWPTALIVRSLSIREL